MARCDEFCAQCRQEWATTVATEKRNQLDAKNALVAATPFCARTGTPTRSRKSSRLFARPLTEESLDQYIYDVESFDNKRGRFSGGVATVAESSRKFAAHKIESKSVRELCLRRDYAGGELDTEGLGKRRTLSRTCSDRHAGLCRTKHKEIFEKARTLGKSLYNMTAKD